MTNLSENILDLDQLKDEPLEIPEVALNKNESSVKERKKPGRKKGSSQRLKGLGNPLLLTADGPKLSREERKTLQLQELFDKMEQKEKRKEDNIRKKRKLNSERSPNLSVTQAESNQEDEGDRQQAENGNNMSPKSDMRSPVRERTPVSKKSEPVKVNSKYFNAEFDLCGSKNLIAYLYEYQKEYGKKFDPSGQNKIDIGTGLFSNDIQTPEGSLVSKIEPEKLNQFNFQLKQQNEKLVEHLKNYEQLQATKDLRHAFYNYDYK